VSQDKLNCSSSITGGMMGVGCVFITYVRVYIMVCAREIPFTSERERTPAPIYRRRAGVKIRLQRFAPLEMILLLEFSYATHPDKSVFTK